LKESITPRSDPKSFANFHLRRSDSDEYLLVCGSYPVIGSCQKIELDGEYNEGLLGYILDGTHQLILITDAEDNIVARALMRVLLEEETNKPVLYIERVYGSALLTRNPALKEALKRFAIQEAKNLGATLVREEQDAHYKPYTKKLYCKGIEQAPCIYSDAAGGIQDGPHSSPAYESEILHNQDKPVAV